MSFGKILVVAGLSIFALGVLLILAEKAGFGRLPGDIAVRGERFSFYFPLASCVVLSVALTLFAWLIQWWRGTPGG